MAFDFPVPPRPRAGPQRAYWRAPHSASALALGIVEAARRHDGLVLAGARDTHSAQSLGFERESSGRSPGLVRVSLRLPAKARRRVRGRGRGVR